MDEIESLFQFKITNRILAKPNDMVCYDLDIRLSIRSRKDSTRAIRKILVGNVLGITRDIEANAVVSTNFKSRVLKLRDYIRSFLAGVRRNDSIVLSIAGDNTILEKQTDISLFCKLIDLNDEEYAALCDVLVISASTGSEGYDSNTINTVIHEGAPTSIEQGRQEGGRCRCNKTDVNYQYHIFPNLEDLLLCRQVFQRKPDDWTKLPKSEQKILKGGQEKGVQYLMESYQFLLIRECYHC